MITVEDIDAVINDIKYGGDGLDPLLLAVEYLTKAKGWTQKVELADAIIATFNEELPFEEMLQIYKGQEYTRKRYEIYRNLMKKAEKLKAIKNLLYDANITEFHKIDQLKEILEVEA